MSLSGIAPPIATFKSMIYLAFILLFTGFYALYSTSEKMRSKQKNRIDQGLFKLGNTAVKICGLVLLILAFVLFILVLGPATGIFVGVVSLMTLASLIVILAPLNLFKS